MTYTKVIHIEKINKLYGDNYLIYYYQNGLDQLHQMKCYIHNSVNILYKIHDYNQSIKLDHYKKGLYSISYLYNKDYHNYMIKTIELLNCLNSPSPRPIPTQSPNHKYNTLSKKNKIINNIQTIINQV